LVEREEHVGGEREALLGRAVRVEDRVIQGGDRDGEASAGLMIGSLRAVICPTGRGAAAVLEGGWLSPEAPGALSRTAARAATLRATRRHAPGGQTLLGEGDTGEVACWVTNTLPPLPVHTRPASRGRPDTSSGGRDRSGRPHRAYSAGSSAAGSSHRSRHRSCCPHESRCRSLVARAFGRVKFNVTRFPARLSWVTRSVRLRATRWVA